MRKESIRHNEIKRLFKLNANLRKRSLILSAVRSFFEKKGFLEVETPVRCESILPESHIEAISSEGFVLRTSPESALKAMLSAGYEKIFEIGPCFRKNESGRIHREEFTMLEWYQAGISSKDLIPWTKDFFLWILEKTVGKRRLKYQNKIIDFSKKWEIIPLGDAFAKFAKTSMADSVEQNRFELDLVEKIEPNLPQNIPVILIGFPAEFRAYSRLSQNCEKIADRWELYAGGMEIANAYTEETDKNELEKIMAKEKEKRISNAMLKYKDNEIFHQAVENGIPPSAGCALGIDRLVMLLTNAQSISEVKI